MKTTKHPYSFGYKNIFPKIKYIYGFEGGAIYKVEEPEKNILIVDCGTLADFLDENECNELIHILEFDSGTELNDYVERKCTNAKLL